MRAAHDRHHSNVGDLSGTGAPSATTTRMLAGGVVEMSTYTARAVRWDHGWELHVEGIGVTQVRCLDHAERQVRDLVESLTDRDASDAPVEIVLDFGELGARTAHVKQLASDAAQLQQRAAAETRQLVAELRDSGISVADVSVLLGVSKGRVSQLTHQG